jgi:uncharacterized protein with HEPN domain
MSSRSDVAKFVKALKYIFTIEQIVTRYQDSLTALKDLEGQPALLMCLMQIGELLNHVHDVDLIEKLEVRKIVAFRNIVAHEYEAVILDKTNSIILENIPKLKLQIIQQLETEADYTELKKLWGI